MSWGWLHSRIHIAGDPYMDRWEIRTPWFAIRLHHILRSDHDRALHDHPWSFVSLILWGGYREVRYSETKPRGADDATRFPVAKIWRRPLSIAFRRAEDAHRLELDRPAWTLVLMGPKRRPWGFYTNAGWVHWRTWTAALEDNLRPGVVYANQCFHKRIVAVVGDVVFYSIGGDHVHSCRAETLQRWFHASPTRLIKVPEPVHGERAA